MFSDYGELSFRELLGALEIDDQDRLRAIDGLAYRDGEDLRVHRLAEIPSPETLPDFPYHRVAMERYVRPTFMGRRTLPHHSSYGCPFTCNFCAVVNMVNGRWLAQTSERVARITRDLVQRYGVNAVELYDNNVSLR